MDGHINPDRDVFARVYDAAWNAVGAVIAVDVSTVDWQAPSVAYRGKTADWLVVAARIVNGTSPTWSIAGRRLPPSGVAPAAFAISPTYPVPGLPKGPFVGGDPYVGIGVAVSVVAWSRGFGVEFCAIDHTGAIGPLQTLAPGSTVRVELAVGAHKVAASIDEHDEARLLHLLNAARIRTR